MSEALSVCCLSSRRSELKALPAATYAPDGEPVLLLATLVTPWVTLAAFGALTSEEHQLRIAKEDAFTSVRAVSRARAAAFSASAAESRCLLDPIHAMSSSASS